MLDWKSNPAVSVAAWPPEVAKQNVLGAEKIYR